MYFAHSFARNFWHILPNKKRISLRLRRVGSESPLFARRNCESLAIQNAPSEVPIRLHERTGWSESLQGAHVRRYVFWRRSSYQEWIVINSCFKLKLTHIPKQVTGMQFRFVFIVGGECQEINHFFLEQTVNDIWAATSENVPVDMCAQRRFRSACAFAQSD